MALGNAQDWISRPTRIFMLLLLVASAVLLRPSIHGNDGVQNYVYVRSLLFDGNLDFSNEYQYYFEKDAGWFDEKRIPKDPVTSRPMNLYGIGNSALWSPWVLAAHGTVMIVRSMGSDVRADGYSWPYEWGVSLGSCFYAVMGLLLLMRLLRSCFGEDCVWGLLGIWLATPLVFYMYLHPSMSHANSFFLSVALLYTYLRHDRKRHWALLGALWSLLIMTRLQDALFILAPALGELMRARKQESPLHWIAKRLTRYAFLVFTAVILFVPQLLAWNYLQGSPWSGPRGYMVAGDLRFWAPAYLWEVAFSPLHGVFYWHPIILLAFLGLLTPGAHSREKLIAIAVFAAQWWIIASWSMWWAGASFGHRMFISTLPYLAFGLCSLTTAEARFRKPLRLVILVLILWNFGYIVQYGTAMIPRDKPVGLRTLIHNNFVEVPKRLLKP